MIAKIAVDKTAYSFDRLFDYLVPAEFENKLKPGCRVLVPFGGGNTRRQGMVMELADTSDYDKTKPFIMLIDDEPVLNGEMISVVKFLTETTFCTYYDAVRTVLPRGINYEIRPDSIKRITADASDRMLTIHPDLKGELPLMTEKQQKAAELLTENGDATFKEVCYLCGISAGVINTLLKKNILISYQRKIQRNPYAFESADPPAEIELTATQNEIFAGVSKQIDEEKASGALLLGITGSGKTQIFIKLIEKTVLKGKSAIMLVPEISLTPQVVWKFKSHFGDNVAVLHSGLTAGEKLDEWERAREGKAKIVVGTRSAVFAPLENLGLIIMDEEGEYSYKSDCAPRYHARDAARFRCAAHNAVLLLASATPSIDSYYYARNGRYTLYELNERYKGAELPRVSIVDLRLDDLLGNTGLVSDVLKEAINSNLEKKEQSLLLLNRRGFNAFAACSDCNQAAKCPNCSVSLTYHKVNGFLMCHYCGYACEFNAKCPQCHGENMKLWGMGTQRIQEELDRLFPQARILRMDTDSTSSRYDFEQKFEEFAAGEYDIMVGTQMIAKGLDFPNVTLVGVLAIDQLLYSGDYKSSERVFSLLTQVVGRSGRAQKQGRAYIQTYTPEHPVINYAAMQDYKGFYNEETGIRKAVLSPPYCDICMIGINGINEDETNAAAELTLGIIKAVVKNMDKQIPLRILGPTKAPIYRLNNKYRMRIMIKCKANAALRAFIRKILIEAGSRKELKNIHLYADLNNDIS